jgi:exonuclease III
MMAVKIAHWNARYLGLKMTQFKVWVAEEMPTIIIVNEVRFRGLTPFLKNYVTIYVEGEGKWGTAMFIKRKIAFKKLWSSSSADKWEGIAIIAVLEGVATTVVGSYWPPGHQPDIREWRDLLNKGKSPHVLVGDFNAHHIAALGSVRTDQRGNVMVKLADEYNLQLRTIGNTWHKPGCRAAQLDLIWITEGTAENGKYTRGEDPLGSDHLPAVFTFKESVQRQQQKWCTNWRKFRACLEQEAAIDDGGKSVEEQVDKLEERIKTALRYSKTETAA